MQIAMQPGDSPPKSFVPPTTECRQAAEYSTPELTPLGSVAELTQAGGGPFLEVSGGGSE